jgi:hypothetical protein
MEENIMANTKAIRKVKGKVMSLDISAEAVLDGKGTCALFSFNRLLFVVTILKKSLFSQRIGYLTTSIKWRSTDQEYFFFFQTPRRCRLLSTIHQFTKMMGKATRIALALLALSVSGASAFAPSSPPSNLRHLEFKMSTTGQDKEVPKMDIDQAKRIISDAISIGAPAYNAGNIQECALAYKAAALEIAPLLPTNLRSSLEKTSQSMMTPQVDGDDNDAAKEVAWAYRRQFDAIIEYQAPFQPDPSTVNNGYTLETFTPQQLPQPLEVLDNVMGGMSRGQWLGQTNTFVGNTSLQNNGGFASLRWRFNTLQNWSYAKGVYLKVRHSKPEEHTFRLILKDTTCEQVRGANFKNVFSTPNQEDSPILIPFTAFDQMEQMGRQLAGPVLNPIGITEIGLMAIKPTVVGDFELTVEDWGLYF